MAISNGSECRVVPLRLEISMASFCASAATIDDLPLLGCPTTANLGVFVRVMPVPQKEQDEYSLKRFRKNAAIPAYARRLVVLNGRLAADSIPNLSAR